jgi:hypothetical protein
MIIKAILCLIIGLTLAPAFAENFVNENFEGRFPPEGWRKEIEGYGRWIKSPNGPWGSCAWGTAGTTGTGYSRAALFSHSFYLERDVYVYYKLNYNVNWGIENEGIVWTRFLLYYDQPGSGYLLRRTLPDSGYWPECSGRITNSKAGRLKAGFKAEVRTYGGGGFIMLLVDNVIVSDRKISPAVSPASLGRVKALFR